MNSLAHINYNHPALINNVRIAGPFGRSMSEFFNTGVTTTTNVPAVNVIETAEGFRIDVAAPGFKKDDFKVNLHHTNLTISATQENKTEEKEGEKYTRREFSFASFQRTFTLPTSVNTETINASYTDGILTISLPKREEAKVKPARQIKIS